MPPASPNQNSAIHPSLPADLATVLEAARSAALQAAQLVLVADWGNVTPEAFAELLRDAQIDPAVQSQYDSVRAELIAASEQHVRFEASCAHSAAFERLEMVRNFAFQCCNSDLHRFAACVDNEKFGLKELVAPVPGIIAACEREAYRAFSARQRTSSVTPVPMLTQHSEGDQPLTDVGPAPQYVTLDQMAALVNRSKKTLEREMNAPNTDMPNPDVEGGGGKPHEWRWDRIRPWLESKYGRQLPRRFPVR